MQFKSGLRVIGVPGRRGIREFALSVYNPAIPPAACPMRETNRTLLTQSPLVLAVEPIGGETPHISRWWKSGADCGRLGLARMLSDVKAEVSGEQTRTAHVAPYDSQKAANAFALEMLGEAAFTHVVICLR